MHRLLPFVVLLAAVSAVSAQQNPPAERLPEPSAVPVLEGPFEFVTAEQPRIKVEVVARGLSHPWGFSFLPDGRILVTERAGTVRVIRDGVLDPEPVLGVPDVFTGVRLAGLMDIALHPEYGENQLVYLTYSKPSTQDGRQGARVAIARGRFEGAVLSEVRDIFVANEWGQGIAASRLLFGPDGLLYVSVGGAINSESTGQHAQDPASHYGKLLRLRDDGSTPDDNPFVGQAGYAPEIYSLGHRNQLGLSFHPQTGELWASENGPLGGDEVNIIRPGRNYGWPVASYSREYSGQRVTDTPWLPEMERPEIVWLPSIAPSGTTFYTGDRFPAWKGNLFVGSMRTGRVYLTGHLERIVFNRQGGELRREWLLTELKQRIRDVRQGPDGLLYVLTEEDDAVLLRISPAD
jgi:glucose/arabinose dehydrogenase